MKNTFSWPPKKLLCNCIFSFEKEDLALSYPVKDGGTEIIKKEQEEREI